MLGGAVIEVWLGVPRARGWARSIVRWQAISGGVPVATVVAGLFLGHGTMGLGIDRSPPWACSC